MCVVYVSAERVSVQRVRGWCGVRVPGGCEGAQCVRGEGSGRVLEGAV